MPGHPFVALADAAKIEMLSRVKPGEIPGRMHSSLTNENIGVGAFSASDARKAAAEHGKVCQNEDCYTHETLTKPSVRVMAIAVVPIFGPQPVERLLSPSEARAMAGSLWAAADLAEASS